LEEALPLDGATFEAFLAILEYKCNYLEAKSNF